MIAWWWLIIVGILCVYFGMMVMALSIVSSRADDWERGYWQGRKEVANDSPEVTE